MKKLVFAVVVLAAMVVGAVLYGFTADGGRQKKEYLMVMNSYYIISSGHSIFIIYQNGETTNIPFIKGEGNEITYMKVIGQLADQGWQIKTQSEITSGGNYKGGRIIMERDKE